MNISGKPVRSAWTRFLSTLTPEERSRALLVVLHDELEKELGKVKVKAKGSHGGHNGIRSCMEHLGGQEFWRIGVGIGRPESRERGEVSEWVLGRVTGREREVLERMSVPRVVSRLRDIAESK